MTKIQRISALALFLLIVGAGIASAASPIPAETLRYRVMYRWGLIHKKAGRATLSFTPGRTTAKAVLTASSEPWADKIYSLRDTLYSTIALPSMTPTYYERVAHEAGRYSRDIVSFSVSGQNVSATTKRYRRARPGAETTEASSTLQAVGTTVDMVSAFYYLRTLPFASMSRGQLRVINIFSGKKKERLTITFAGPETIDLNGRSYDTYHIRFRFTTEGSKKSSDDIDTWIEAAAPHRPLKLEGHLKIGKIMCLLEP